MAVFRYSVTLKAREDFREEGTVVARTEDDARQKLKRLELRDVRLKKMNGMRGWMQQFSADVR